MYGIANAPIDMPTSGRPERAVRIDRRRRSADRHNGRDGMFRAIARGGGVCASCHPSPRVPPDGRHALINAREGDLWHSGRRQTVYREFAGYGLRADWHSDKSDLTDVSARSAREHLSRVESLGRPEANRPTSYPRRTARGRRTRRPARTHHTATNAQLGTTAVTSGRPPRPRAATALSSDRVARLSTVGNQWQPTRSHGVMLTIRWVGHRVVSSLVGERRGAGSQMPDLYVSKATGVCSTAR